MYNAVEKKVKKVKESIAKNENVYNIGQVISVSLYTISVSGLNDVIFYEAVNIANKASGYVMSIHYDKVIIALTSINEPIKVGDEVTSLGYEHKGIYSLDSVGKVVDIFGYDLIKNKKLDHLINTSVDTEIIPLMDREITNRELSTNISSIDLLYPIGKGQRQLIIGDKKTGKTKLALDIILNQKDKNVMCFYVAIGKNKNDVKEIYYKLTEMGASSYTTVFASFNTDLPTNIYLTPFITMNAAENLMKQGYDVLIVLDDLNKHADAYRNLTLANEKKLGKAYYPVDLFYAQAKILENGLQHKEGGSITILPIVETRNNDTKDYLCSNIISMCDGQWVLSANIDKQYPSIDYSLSTSKFSDKVQSKDLKVLSRNIKNKLINYLELNNVYELVNQEELPIDIKKQLEEGKKILNTLNQIKFNNKSKDEIKKMFNFLDKGGAR